MFLWPQNSRLKMACMVATTGERRSDMMTPPIWPSRITAQVVSPEFRSHCSVKSITFLGAKSSIFPAIDC